MSTGFTPVEDREWSAYSGRRPLIFISIDEKGPVRAVSLVARERLTDEGRAAGEKKHDEA